MALKHKWLKEANQELLSTLDYIQSYFGEQTVQIVYSKVSARIKQLQEFPDSGLRYKDLSYKGNKVRISHMKRSSIVMMKKPYISLLSGITAVMILQ